MISKFVSCRKVNVFCIIHECLFLSFTWRHGGHVSLAVQRNGGQVGVLDDLSSDSFFRFRWKRLTPMTWLKSGKQGETEESFSPMGLLNNCHQELYLLNEEKMEMFE